MKSTKRFSKKWKWSIIGASCGIVTIGSLALGIALSVENKSIQASSKYFIGQNTVNDFFANLEKNGFTDGLPKSSDAPAWLKLAKHYENDMNIYTESSQLSNLVNNPEFSTYRINSASLSNLSIKNKNLLLNTKNNLDSLLGNQSLNLNYYTLDSAPFFNSKVNLFCSSVIDSLKSATNDKLNFKIIPRSPTTVNQVYYNNNCELGSLFWSPDYNDVSAWIGYLFSQNNGWITGNLWPCLWALLSGANPTNGQFTYNNQALPDSNYKYQNAPTFQTQLSWTNARRAAMGLGVLPGWATSLYYTLYTLFPDTISWNTNYGWWQMQYNNNNADGNMLYALEDWCTSVENVQVVLSNTASNHVFTTKPALYTSESALVKFISWIDAFDPSMPFFSSGNNFTKAPILTREGIYPLNNPASGYTNSEYFINLHKTQFSLNNPFVYFIPGSVVSSVNFNYFAPVLSGGGFFQFAGGLYSGMMNYVPYNYLQNEQGNKQYSAGYGVSDVPNKTLLKLVDATNFKLLDVTNKFKGAHYNQTNGDLVHGDTITTSGSDANTKLLFISNPSMIITPNNPQALLSESAFDNFVKDHKNQTWSTYKDYEDFAKYNVLTLTDGNLATAINSTDAYQFTLNKKVKWLNSKGQVTNSIQPEDFNNSIAWMAASYSDYSYNSQKQTLGQVQANSYMLQEIGLAGKNFSLGVGTGFFQTEEYAPNNNPNGDTFTYFISPNNITSTQAKGGWDGGSHIAYFLSQLAFQNSYLDPIPSDTLAFHNLGGKNNQLNKFNNLTVGQLTQDYMGNNINNGVWNISTAMTNAINDSNTKEFNKLYNEIEQNPAYLTLVANKQLNNNVYAILYIYGSGINPSNGKPQMSSDLRFNGGYYANSNSFTTSSIRTQIHTEFFSAISTPAGGPLFGPASQKINFIKYQWSSNITQQEELIMYLSGQIDYDSNVQPQQLLGVTLKPGQAVYYAGNTSNKSLNLAWYNAFVFNLTSSASTGSFAVPTNQNNQPLIQLDINSKTVSKVDSKNIDGKQYYAKYGYPYINDKGQVLYTNPNDTSAKLKSYATPSYLKIVGTALNPFIYGTTGAEIRQDITALINWTSIASVASYPLPQGIIANSVIPYGNFHGNFEYISPTSKDPVVVHDFYQYAAATAGTGIIGTPLFWSLNNQNKKSNLYYESDFNNATNAYSEYEWDFMNTINGR